MIEEGFINHEISATILKKYLNNKKLQNIDTLILGCTHYPLIKKEIEKFYKGNVKVLDSAEIISDFITLQLQKSNLINVNGERKYHFVVSNYTRSFEKSAFYFFKENIKLEEIDIWK